MSKFKKQTQTEGTCRWFVVLSHTQYCPRPLHRNDQTHLSKKIHITSTDITDIVHTIKTICTHLHTYTHMHTKTSNPDTYHRYIQTITTKTTQWTSIVTNLNSYKYIDWEHILQTWTQTHAYLASHTQQQLSLSSLTTHTQQHYPLCLSFSPSLFHPPMPNARPA